MRSICERPIDSNSTCPSVADPTRTPSISTTVLPELAPRMNTLAAWPGPPLRETCRPASRRSRSSTESALLARMRSASITTTSAVTRSSGRGSRLPVTTIGVNCVCAWEGAATRASTAKQPVTTRVTAKGAHGAEKRKVMLNKL